MKSQILEAVRKYDTIIIHRHVRPDPDAFGSQGGLAEILKASFPEKTILSAGMDEESLYFMRKMDTVPEEAYENALVIVCDTANQERICGNQYGKGSMLIKIDHHPNDDQYGDLIWVDTSASSTSEMIFELYQHGKEEGLVLTREAARLLYAGIVGDTGRFLFQSTTKKTFKYAGELIEYNFSLPELYEGMYSTKVNTAHLTGYVLQNFEMDHNTGVAFMKIPKEILEKYGVKPSEASQLVSALGNIEGIKAWVFFVEEKDQIRVRLRSKGPVINNVARKYNGGGHPMAAGASIYSWEEAAKVISDLEDTCKAWANPDQS